MRLGGPRTPPGHGTGPHQEGSLNRVTFVGSFPRANFRLDEDLPEVALIGRSNVGKSSLLNALVGRKAIARTSKSPGKTRDCNVYLVDELMYLIDLPGYGYARAAKSERRRFRSLIDESLVGRDSLVGVVWLLDIRRDLSVDDVEIGEVLVGRGVPVLIAVTKSDKVRSGRRGERLKAIAGAVSVPEDQTVLTSAVTKDGITDLRESILALVARPEKGQ